VRAGGGWELVGGGWANGQIHLKLLYSYPRSRDVGLFELLEFYLNVQMGLNWVPAGKRGWGI
jgi:hypothetical protein